MIFLSHSPSVHLTLTLSFSHTLSPFFSFPLSLPDSRSLYASLSLPDSQSLYASLSPSLSIQPHSPRVGVILATPGCLISRQLKPDNLPPLPLSLPRVIHFTQLTQEQELQKTLDNDSQVKHTVPSSKLSILIPNNIHVIMFK